MTPIRKIIDGITVEVQNELFVAMGKFPRLNSYHEAYAVIMEEVDELWVEIKKKRADQDVVRNEAIQVAAMAIRLILDCCEEVGHERV